MSEMKHTPGPWEIFTIMSSAGTSSRIYAPAGEGYRDIDIAHIPTDWNGDGSNARLIAAAPELLEVLERALKHSNCPGENCVIDWHAQAAIVIAKAKGEL